MLPLPDSGIVKYFTFEVADDFFLGTVRGLHQVVHINLAVEIQAACQRFNRCQPFVRVYLLERHRLTHDVGLD